MLNVIPAIGNKGTIGQMMINMKHIRLYITIKTTPVIIKTALVIAPINLEMDLAINAWNLSPIELLVDPPESICLNGAKSVRNKVLIENLSAILLIFRNISSTKIFHPSAYHHDIKLNANMIKLYTIFHNEAIENIKAHL